MMITGRISITMMLLIAAASQCAATSRQLEGVTVEGANGDLTNDGLRGDCQVLKEDGTDVTDKMVSKGDYEGHERTVVTCMDTKSCMRNIVSNCDVIRCEGLEACQNMKVIDPSLALLCDGRHSCHRTELVVSQSESIVEGSGNFKVQCKGSGACNVAQLVSQSLPMDVVCDGPKACRKATIKANDGTVECKNGGTRYEACRGSVAIRAKCLKCNGDMSCGEHINVCKFSQTGDNWQICQSDSNFGDC